MRSRFLLPVAAALALAACSSGSSSSGDTNSGVAAPSFNQFTDIPLPEDAHMDRHNTLVVGQGENWMGRLDYTLRWSSAPQLFDFYKEQMPRYKWQEISSVRAAISVMTYRRGDRIATVQIEDRTLVGVEVIITMSPTNNNSGASSNNDDYQPPPQPSAAPKPSVTQEPLK